MNPPRNEDTLMRDPDVTIVARLKVDPEFVIALYHEQRKRIAELEAQIPKTVVPRDIETYESGHGWWTRAWTCPSCGTRKHKGTDTQGQMPKNDAFCTCGAELNWEEK